MVSSNTRFDFEKMKAQERARKRAAKQKMIVSWVVQGALVIAICIGAKIGWDKWRMHVEEQERIEKAEKLAEERAEQARIQKQEQARKEREERQKRLEAERQAEKIRIEREKIARETAKREEEERRRKEEAHAAEQSRRRFVAEQLVAQNKLTLDKRIVVECGIESQLEIYVSDDRWKELTEAAQIGSPDVFLGKLKCDTVQWDFQTQGYPDRETMETMMGSLNDEQFMMVARITTAFPKGVQLHAMVPNAERGFIQLSSARRMNNGQADIGFTIPFKYDSQDVIYFMTTPTAKRIIAEWNEKRKEFSQSAARLNNRTQYVQERMAEYLPTFVASVKVQLTTPAAQLPPPPPKKEVKKTQPNKNQERRPRLIDSNVRGLRGPSSRR